jgi:hypothetical protein
LVVDSFMFYDFLMHILHTVSGTKIVATEKLLLGSESAYKLKMLGNVCISDIHMVYGQKISICKMFFRPRTT